MADAVESVFGGAIIGENDTISFIKVLHSHSSEAFLSSCVPHQQLDVLAIDLDILDFKINTHSRNVSWGKLIIRELLQKTTLTDCGVTQSDHLNFHVKLSLLARGGAPRILSR